MSRFVYKKTKKSIILRCTKVYFFYIFTKFLIQYFVLMC